jgi:predicted lipoprotein with Yx(FWY)xxD motif
MNRVRTYAVLGVAALAGVGTAAITGLASAKSKPKPTLQVAHNVSVGGKKENIVVDSRGRTLYTLSGNTAKHPGSCTSANSCFMFWPPSTVSSSHSKVTAAPGIRGILSKLHRGKIFQVVLGSSPLYRYSGDNGKGQANGDGIRTFGGVWRVIVVKSSSTHTTTSTSTTTTSSPMPTTTTSSNPYPTIPGY